MLDYNSEAATYDRSRGGEARAEAAAQALGPLLPQEGLVLDVGCGTGIVTARLQAPGRRVVGVDRAAGMLGVAAGRLPVGSVVLGDATRLPFAESSCDAVVLLWVLHLLEPAVAARVVAEAARVVRPGGTVVTTVGKNDANFATGSDVTEVIAPVRARYLRPQADAEAAVRGWAAERGMAPSGEAGFVGLGQGRSPREWRHGLKNHPWTADASEDELAALRDELAALPEQDRPRADPVYRVVGFRGGRRP